MAEYFPWNKKLETSIPEIDAQHKKLVELINQFYQAFNDDVAKKILGSILDELIRYTIVHFTFEEKFFTSLDANKFEDHLKQHQAFKAKVLEFKTKFERGNPITFRVMNFLREWLINHIEVMDMQYVEMAKNKTKV
jgi:hemerythrin